MNQVKKYYQNLIDTDIKESVALRRTALVWGKSIKWVKKELVREKKTKPRKPQVKRL